MKRLLQNIKERHIRIINKPIQLAIVLIAAVFIFSALSFCWAKVISKVIFQTEKLNYSNNYTYKDSDPMFVTESMDPKLKNRIQWQYHYTKNKEEYHLNVVDYFHEQYYAVTVTFSICCIIAALTLFIIGKNGWNNTDKRILTTFLVFSATSVYFGNCPSFFQMEKNITDNQELFKSYCKVENNLLSFMATLPSDSSKKYVDTQASLFVKSIDNDLEKLNYLTTGIDITKVKSTNEVLQSFNKPDTLKGRH